MLLFIRAIRDKELTSLVRKGNPTEAMLQQAASTIMLDFCHLSGNPGYTKMLSVYRKAARISARIARVEIIQRLASYGIDISAELKAAIGGMSPETALRRWEKERKMLYASISERDPDSDETGSLDFDSVTNELEMYTKREIDLDKITVSRYALLIKQYHEYIKNQRNGRNRKSINR